MSFILRRHKEDGKETNKEIGEQYIVIRKDCNEKEFDAVFKNYCEMSYNSEIPKDSEDYLTTFAFIIFNEGTEFIALNHTDNVYIMTDGGKTFSNLTLKRK